MRSEREEQTKHRCAEMAGVAAAAIGKPDLVAPTGLATRSWGSLGGTSGAPPHVAGVAALLLEAYPNTTANGMSYLVAARAQPLSRDAGAGLVAAGAPDLCLCGPGDDVAYGNTVDDRLQGNAGADRLYGGDGSDRVAGGRGDDRVAGGGGPDVVRGGPGADVLWGGPGKDRCISGVAAGCE